MNRKRRKLLSLLLAGALIISMCPDVSFSKPTSATDQTELNLSFDESVWTYKDAQMTTKTKLKVR